ncbi:DNA mismatch repair protein Mlh3 [Biomphalaria glabrata]|nr:DNA mismatch repair protein Mlh3 [Biomphalaria glabrata]
MIRHLSDDVKSLLRTGVALTSCAQAIEELVLNAVDAGASTIAVRVDLECFKIQVVDNGAGISKDQLPLLGERYATSKCKGLDDLLNLKYFGYRGEAIASLQAAATFLEIVSRPRSSGITYCKYFKEGKAVGISQSSVPRPSHGTTVTVHNLFYNLPVRRKCFKEGLEMERIRYRLAGIAIMWPQISFSLRDDSIGHVILQTHKCNGLAAAFSTIFPVAKSRNMSEVSIEQDEFKLSGIVSTDSYSRKDLQFVFVNKRLVLKSSIHHQVNKIFSRSLILRKKGLMDATDSLFQNGTINSVSPTKQSDRFAIFAINVECPFYSYDITFDPQKTLVEFTNWPKLIHLLQDMLYGFLRKENLLSISDFSSILNDDREDGNDSSSEECYESSDSYFSQLDRFIRKNEGNNSESKDLQTEKLKLLTAEIVPLKPAKDKCCVGIDQKSKAVDTSCEEELLKTSLKSVSDDDKVCSLKSGIENLLQHDDNNKNMLKINQIVTHNKNNFSAQEINFLPPKNTERGHAIIYKEHLESCNECIEPYNSLELHQTSDSETPFIVSTTEENESIIMKEDKVLKKPVQKVVFSVSSKYSSTLQKLRGNTSANNALQSAKASTSTLQKLRASTKKAVQSLGDLYKTPVRKILPDSSVISQDLALDRDKTMINLTLPEFCEPQGSTMLNAFLESRSLGQSDRNINLKRSKDENVTRATKLARLMKGENVAKGRSITTAPSETDRNTSLIKQFSFEKRRPVNQNNLTKTEENCYTEDMEAAVKIKRYQDDRSDDSQFSKIKKLHYDHISRPPYSVQLSSCYPHSSVVGTVSKASERTLDVLTESVSLTESEHKTNSSKCSCATVALPSLKEMIDSHCSSSTSQHLDRLTKQDEVVSSIEDAVSFSNRIYSEQHLTDRFGCTHLQKSNFKNIDSKNRDIYLQYNDLDLNKKLDIQKQNFYSNDEVNIESSPECVKNPENCLHFLKETISTKDYFQIPNFTVHKQSFKAEKTSRLLVPERSSIHSSHVSFNDKTKSCAPSITDNPKTTCNETLETDSGKKLSLPHCFCKSIENKDKVNEIEEVVNLPKVKDLSNSHQIPHDANLSLPVCDISNFHALKTTNDQASQINLMHSSPTIVIEMNMCIQESLNNYQKPASTSNFSANQSTNENYVTGSIINETEEPFLANKSFVFQNTLKELMPDKYVTNIDTVNEPTENVLKDATDQTLIKQNNEHTLAQNVQLTNLNPAQAINDNQVFDVSNTKCTINESTEIGRSLSQVKAQLDICISNDRHSLPQPLSTLRSLRSKALVIVEETPGITSASESYDYSCFKQNSVAEVMSVETTLLPNVPSQNTEAIFSIDQDYVNKTSHGIEDCHWKELTDDVSGQKMYVNIKSGNTISESQWSDLTLHEPPAGNKNEAMTGQLSGSQKECLQSIVSDYIDQEQTEADSKWKEGEKPTCEKNQVIEISEVITQWKNPVFFNYKSPTLNVETCPTGQIARSCFNSLNMIEFTKDMLKNVKVVGQLDRKFIACLINTKATAPSKVKLSVEDNSMLVLFDQHAVHERVRLEQLTQEAYEVVDGGITDQVKMSALPEPILMLIDRDDLRIMKTFYQEFNRIGIHFLPDDTCRDQIYIKSVPSCLAEKYPTEKKRLKQQPILEKIQILISEHIQLLKSTNGAGGRLPLSLHRVLCSQACHGAVKFGDSLSTKECQDLLSSLALCDLPFQCAHGRPSIAPLVDLVTLDDESPYKRCYPKLSKLSQKINI